MASSIAKVRIELTVDEVAELLAAVDAQEAYSSDMLECFRDSIDDSEYGSAEAFKSSLVNCQAIREAVERASL